MLSKEIFQGIFTNIEPLLPAKWEKVVFYVEFGENSYSMDFYVKERENFIKCYDLGYISEEEILSAFGRIDMIVAPARASDNEMWSNMTMIVDSDGKMYADFDYTDFSQMDHEWKKNWKKKYLVNTANKS